MSKEKTTLEKYETDNDFLADVGGSDLVTKLKIKITGLINQSFEIKFLPSEQYERNIIKIDKIKISKMSISSYKDGFEKQRWEWTITLDFERNPILSGKDAEEVYNHFIGENKNLAEMYLSS